MEDGDEFQIQFFNPFTYVIAASISINGSDFSNYLVLKPGERVWLERFIDTDKKFCFSTYEVGTSDEIKAAIAKNGIITIKVFKERPKRNNPIIFVSNPQPSWDNLYCNSISVGNSYHVKEYCDSPVLGSSSCYYNSSVTTCSAGDSVATAAATMDSCESYTSLDSDSANTNRLLNPRFKKSKTQETGRIEEGSHSNQELHYVSGYDFETWPFRITTFHIFPKSTKPVFKSDLVKKYCPNCGRKLSPKHKFCPYCGEKIK